MITTQSTNGWFGLWKARAEAAEAEVERLREALILAEDVLSRSPFSNHMWPNGMHPQVGMEQIRAALEAQPDLPENPFNERKDHE